MSEYYQYCSFDEPQWKGCTKKMYEMYEDLPMYETRINPHIQRLVQAALAAEEAAFAVHKLGVFPWGVAAEEAAVAIEGFGKTSCRPDLTHYVLEGRSPPPPIESKHSLKRPHGWYNKFNKPHGKRNK